MASGNAPLPPRPRKTESDLALPEGLEAGLVAGLVVIAVYLVRDVATGGWLHTPTVLGTLLLFGPEAAREAGSAPEIAAVYNVVHFAGWTALGFAGTAVARASERHALPPAAVLTTVFCVFLLLTFGLDAWAHRAALPRTHLWLGSLAGGIALVAFLAWRHPEPAS